MGKEKVAFVFIFILIISSILAVSALCVIPRDGMLINKTTTFCKGVYFLPRGVAIVENSITLDCNGAILMGNVTRNYTHHGDIEAGITVGTWGSVGPPDSNGIYPNSVVKNCIVRNYNYGIYSWYGDGIILTNNILFWNDVGIELDNGQGVTPKISENKIFENLIGILLSWGRTNAVVNGNLVKSNDFGISISGSRNTVYLNNFINNNASTMMSETPNSWNYRSQGNYWSDYNILREGCADSNSNGMCDSPYVINANNIDYYPLTRRVF